jgi:hypothetical protein
VIYKRACAESCRRWEENSTALPVNMTERCPYAAMYALVVSVEIGKATAC